MLVTTKTRVVMVHWCGGCEDNDTVKMYCSVTGVLLVAKHLFSHVMVAINFIFLKCREESVSVLIFNHHLPCR